jgi:hypothetical protein
MNAAEWFAPHEALQRFDAQRKLANSHAPLR